ncbi:MAG: NAD(+)/NADH kinase [Treponema sp.]|jgi:NAD+ kinase|nr:NAD(+)/NADH kinase [Treponema sp.]
MGNKAILFVNVKKKYASDTSAFIQTELEKRGIETTTFSFDGKPEKQSAKKYDIAFSIGGDGTVLYAARCLAPMGVPILPVNLGKLGFIAGVNRDDWLDIFNKWEKREISMSRRCMFEVSVERASCIVMKNVCLNDIVISASGIAKLINLDVHVNSGESVTALGFYRSDGLIISTPTGSTAYSMAAGGPILDPEMEAVILTPICPFSLSNRPFVLPSRQIIEITVANEQRSGVLLTVDGQDTFKLECADKVFVQQAPKPALLIYSGKQTYYSALLTKLFHSGDEKNAAVLGFGKEGDADA